MGVSAIKHITVALDGSPASDAAVRFACELARAGAEISFCSVLGDAQATIGEGIAEADPSDTPERAREICEAAVGQARALGIKADRHDSHLRLAEAVAACAQEHASEAIVIGSNTRKGLARLRDGVGDSLMRIADRPVIFVHEADEYRGGDIAVTISGYDTSYLVLDAAIAIALALKRELFLITEITVPKGVDYYAPGSNSDTRLVAAAARALASGVKSGMTVGDGIGSIPGSLIELAERRDCSMIVTGLHDRSGIARFFNGSVAHQIVLDAHVPVTVVHHAFHPDRSTVAGS
jgi:nucleotide-binding universal stress UspA family protein